MNEYLIDLILSKLGLQRLQPVATQTVPLAIVNQIRRLEAALRPFGDAAKIISGDYPDNGQDMTLLDYTKLTYGDFRLAADALGIPYEGIDGMVHPIVPAQFLYADDDTPMDDDELDAVLRQLQPVATEKPVQPVATAVATKTQTLPGKYEVSYDLFCNQIIEVEVADIEHVKGTQPLLSETSYPFKTAVLNYVLKDTGFDPASSTMSMITDVLDDPFMRGEGRK